VRRAELSLAEARRVALGAQGFLDPPHAVVSVRTLMRAVSRTQVLQIDSVNVVQRAHYVPVFSRVGPYDTSLLDRASGAAPRRLVEYWAHVAAFMPVELWPLMRHRMRHYRDNGHDWITHRPELVAELMAEIRGGGAATARDLDQGLPRRTDHWGWNWSETKKALEYLFAAGEVAIAGRSSSFERLYDLPERVLPQEVLAAPEPPVADAERELVRRAARAHGVASLRCLADYFRMSGATTRRAVRDLVEVGELVPVRVAGWGEPTFLHRDARVPRRVRASALLSPFDPLVWERTRTERLFGFRYRIEIYLPEHRRVHGYYVLPFLLGDRLVARVDLKADRRSGTLLVRSAHAEDGVPPDTAEQLAGALREMAGWLRLPHVRAEGSGDLTRALAIELAHV
jgi:uncharacterized protein